MRVVLQYVPAKEGDSAENIDTDSIRDSVARLSIFAEQQVTLTEISDGGLCRAECHLQILVKEKWSLYPVPVYVKYRDTEIGGAFLVESNLFGQNKGGVIGGLISNRGWQALAGYTDPHIGYSRFSTTMRYLTGRVFLEDATTTGVVTRSYTLMRHDFQSATLYEIRHHLFLGVLAGLRSAQVIDSPAVNSAMNLNFGARFRYSDIVPQGYFQQGFESTLDLEQGVAAQGEKLHVISSATAWHYRPFRKQFLSLLYSFQWSEYPAVLEQRLGGWQGTRTLPALLIPADRFTVAAVNYQYALFEFPWVTFAAIAFVDAGAFARDRENATYFWGPGGGVRMYLSQMTIPALGVDVARDMVSRQLQISFFFGYNLQ
ncbi:hypothetical protein [Turneriella parva]|nr:hypothetical protein [Turneriella parva]